MTETSDVQPIFYPLQLLKLIDLDEGAEENAIYEKIQALKDERNSLREKQEAYTDERKKFIEGLKELKTAYSACKIKRDENNEELVQSKSRIERLSAENTELRISKLKSEHLFKEQTEELRVQLAQLQRKLDDKEESVELQKAANLSKYMQKTEEYFGKMLDNERSLFTTKEESMLAEIASRQSALEILEKEKLDSVKVIASLRKERDAGRTIIEHLQKQNEFNHPPSKPELFISSSDDLEPIKKVSVCSVHVQTEPKTFSGSTESLVQALTTIDEKRLGSSSSTNDHLISALKAENESLKEEKACILEDYDGELARKKDEITELRDRMRRMECEKEREIEAWRRLLNRVMITSGEADTIVDGSEVSEHPKLLIHQRYQCEVKELQRDRIALANRLRSEQLKHANELALLRSRVDSIGFDQPLEPVNLEYIRAVMIRTFTSAEQSVRRASLNALTMILGCSLEQRYALLRIFDHYFKKGNIPTFVGATISKNTTAQRKH